jgi:hypothetical protein
VILDDFAMVYTSSVEDGDDQDSSRSPFCKEEYNFCRVAVQFLTECHKDESEPPKQPESVCPPMHLKWTSTCGYVCDADVDI